VDLEALGTEEGETEVVRLIIMMDRLGPEFYDHVQNVLVNLLFPEADTVYLPLKPLTKNDPTGLQILEIPTVAALQPLVEKLKDLKSPKFFAVTLHDPSWTDETPSYSMLNHAVPFADLSYKWRLDWVALWFRKPERVNHYSNKYVDDQHKKIFQQGKAKRYSATLRG
jgi:hypothetical protein